jgi:hypothetical protein
MKTKDSGQRCDECLPDVGIQIYTKAGNDPSNDLTGKAVYQVDPIEHKAG